MASASGVQTAAGSDEAAFFSRLDEVAAYLATQPADGRQSLLGTGSHESGRPRSFAANRRPKSPPALLAEARAIHEEDRRMCRAIGRHGAELLSDGQGVLTHCNAGGLATAEYGTALAVFFAAAEQGKRLHVYADETRPLLQGARLTAWELQQRGIRRDA